MTAQNIDGKLISSNRSSEVAARVKRRTEALGFTRPGLAVVLVGEDPALRSHVKVSVKRVKK